MSVWVVCTVCMPWLRVLFRMPELAISIHRDVDDWINLSHIVSVRAGLDRVERKLVRVPQSVMFASRFTPIRWVWASIFYPADHSNWCCYLPWHDSNQLDLPFSIRVAGFGVIVFRRRRTVGLTINASRLYCLLQPFHEAILPKYDALGGSKAPVSTSLLLAGGRPHLRELGLYLGIKSQSRSKAHPETSSVTIFEVASHLLCG